MKLKKYILKAGDPVSEEVLEREHIRLVMKKNRDVLKASRILGLSLAELETRCQELKLISQWKHVAHIRKNLENVRVKL